MIFIGLTGGIGSGKTTAARLLADHGAVVVEADALAREAVQRGTPGYSAVLAAFGPEVVRADGELDRKRLAQIVFADDERRRALEAIVHPEVRRRVAQVVADHAGTHSVVVLDSPLLIETEGHRDVQVVVVVTAKPETQIARLVARGMDEADARARLAAQMPLEEKARKADVLLDNEGTPEELAAQVDTLWTELRARA